MQETHDQVINEKALRIGQHFRSAFEHKRSELGLVPLAGNSILGKEAYLTSLVLAVEEPATETYDKYEMRLREAGYKGHTAFSYVRHIWKMDTPDRVIVNELLELFSDDMFKGNIGWEDVGYGICHGYPGGDQSRIGVCVVIGLGCVEGYVHALDYINSARALEGANPLELSLELRETALRLDAIPEVSSALLGNVITESGYGGPNRRIRFAYNGGHKLMPKDVKSVTLEEQGKRIADTLLEKHKDLLMRSDWKHIGIASGLVTRSSIDNMQGVWLQVSFILAWQMPGDANRPAHFPPSMVVGEQTSANLPSGEKPRKRWWWPFGH